ncbi:MAG TPA: aspartate aminotransferase family protein [Chloroflexota bacterium]|nr:aspartate aminotransferase family protein [Chloroflexota bacterium]
MNAATTDVPDVPSIPAEVLDYERTYAETNPGSRRLYAEAMGVFPSGVAHDIRYLQPFPIYCERAEGAYKWDVDGHRYVDYLVGHGALLLGHSHPALVQAVEAQIRRGTHFGAAHELEIRWGQLVQRLIPSAERVKFVASGTEATHLALRLARSFTGKEVVVKFEGHFHGWHDYATAAVDPPYEIPASSGVPAEVLATMRVVPTDLARVEAALDAGDVAAVILEPTGASWGTVPVDETFLRGLRELTRDKGVVLIFDEVITGFRCAPGGAQGAYGITPDLTTLAKILAGGLPGGAVAGRAEILDLLKFGDDPGWNRGRRISHPGTFNANPLSAAAGIACLEIVAQGEVHRHVNRLAERLRAGWNAAGARYGLQGCAYGSFSMVHTLFDRSLLQAEGGPRYVKNKDVIAAKLRRAMLVQGVDLMGAGGMLSFAHTEADVEHTVTAFANALAVLDHEGLL